MAFAVRGAYLTLTAHPSGCVPLHDSLEWTARVDGFLQWQLPRTLERSGRDPGGYKKILCRV